MSMPNCKQDKNALILENNFKKLSPAGQRELLMVSMALLASHPNKKVQLRLVKKAS